MARAQTPFTDSAGGQQYRIQQLSAAMGGKGPERLHALLLQVPICLPGLGTAKPATRVNKPQKNKEKGNTINDLLKM